MLAYIFTVTYLMSLNNRLHSYVYGVDPSTIV